MTAWGHMFSELSGTDDRSTIDDELIPMASAQEHLWAFIRALNPAEPGATFMTVPIAVRIRDSLSIDGIRGALRSVFDRHEILRATMTDLGPTPRLRISPESTPIVDIVDLSDNPPNEARRLAGDLAAREDDRAFDLVNGPLVRIQLLRLGATDHALLVTAHHLVMDAASIDIFLRDLWSFYDASMGCTTAELASLRERYRDFAVRGRSSDPGRSAYWRSVLSSDRMPALFPSDRPRAELDRSVYEIHQFEIPVATARAVKVYAEQHDATPFIVCLAAFTRFVCRKTGVTELVIGSAVSNRMGIGLRDVVGQFPELMIAATAVNLGETFEESTYKTRANILAAYSHAVSYHELVAQVSDLPWGDFGPPNQLFQAWFQFTGKVQFPGSAHLQVEPFAGQRGTAIPTRSYSLGASNPYSQAWQSENPTFELDDDCRGGVVQYNSSLFDESSVLNLAAEFIDCLAICIAADS